MSTIMQQNKKFPQDSIPGKLQFAIANTLRSVFQLEREESTIHLERPANESFGDWSTNVAMTLAKELRRSPVDIAKEIKTSLEESKLVELNSIDVVGGFINFKVKDEFVIKQAIKNVGNENWGNSNLLNGKKIMVEFAHPNPFKSFHIGHLRNIFIGESLVRLLESQGAEVIRVNYQGDVGMHIAKCLWSFKKVDPSTYPASANEKVALLGKCYTDGAAAFEESEESKEEIKAINKLIYTREDEEINRLWNLGKEWSLDKFHEIYARVDSTFEREFMESETLPYVDDAITLAKEKGILVESEGALIFDGKKFDMETRVFLNSQGLPTYEGKELGLAQLKYKEYGLMDLHIHNVAVEHVSFFKVTFKVKELLWPEIYKDRQYHNAYEFVGLKSGKMSSRKGKVVLGNDILDQAVERIKEIVKARGIENYDDELAEKIGVGAVKYSFLKISPFTYLAFDMEESLNFEGDSGPYVQYAYARAKSIINEAKKIGINIKTDEVDSNLLNGAEEINLMRWLDRFEETVTKAAFEYSPHYISTFVYELTQRFNKFYNTKPILKADREEEKYARLLLTELTATTIAKALDLLGIKVVEQM